VRSFDPRLAREVPAVRRFLAGCGVLAALGAGAILAQAILLGDVVAAAFVEHKSVSQLAPRLVALALVSVLRGLVAALFEGAGALTAAATLSSLRLRVLSSLVRARPGGIGELRTGEVAGTLLDGGDALEPYFARFLPQLALATVVPPVLLAWVLWRDWISGVLLLVTLPLIPVFGILIGRATQHATMKRFRVLQLLSVHFLDVVRGLPTLRAYRRGAAQTASIGRYTDDYRSSTMATLRIAFLSAFVLELAATLGTALVAVELGIRLVDGTVGLASAFAVLVLAPEIYAPLRAASSQFHASADGVAAAGALLELAALEPIATGTEEAPVPGTLELAGVAAAYDGRGRVLVDVDFEVQPGERVAIVGPSGAGKSTLLGLVLRFAEPVAGRLLVDGRDLAAVDPGAWRRQLAWVPQRPLLEPGPVADALRLGRADATDDDLGAALAAAGLFVSIETHSETLSAGERRRVALARALLRDAPLLLLDEPTAHLDAASAEAVVDVLAALPPASSVLVATHDTRVLRAVDRVLELRDGTLRERGLAAA
jgi:thiol reductant ABC exporter CydD subunit